MPFQVVKTADQVDTDNPDTSNEGWGKTIGGIIGGTAGQILGTPLDLVTGPAGTITGGAIGGGAGGAIGDIIDQLVGGKGYDLKRTLGSAGEESAYGAIPVGEEMRAVPLLGKMAGSLPGRSAIRATTGAIGGALAKGSENISKNKPVLEDMLSTALGTGAINTVSPAIAKVAKVPLRMLANTGKTVSKIVEEKASMLNDVVANRLQKILGPEVVDTAANGAFLDPEFKSLVDKYDLNNSSIKKIGDNLKQASGDTELQLQGLLNNPDAAITRQEINPQLENIVQNSVGSQGWKGQTRDDFNNFISNELKKYGGAETIQSGGPAGTVSSYDTAPIPLSSLLKLERSVGAKANWGEKGADPYKDLYFGIREMINKKVADVSKETGDTTFNDLMTQHQRVIDMQNRYNSLYAPGTRTLPEEVSNFVKSKSDVLSKIMKSPEAQTAALAAGSVFGSKMLPNPLQSPAEIIGLLASLTREAPRLAQNSDIAKNVVGLGKKAESLVNSSSIDKALQQLGIRLPGSINH